MSTPPRPAASAPGTWAEVRALFEALQPLPVAGRAARLASSGATVAVRAEVLALLDADAGARQRPLPPPA